MNNGWTLEGVAGFTSSSPDTHLNALHRLFWPSRQYHFYTTDEGEKNALVAAGLTYEGVTGYVIPANPATNGGNQCAY